MKLDLRNNLPRGYAKTIAYKLKISIDRVYNVVRGLTTDYGVEKELIVLARENIRNRKACERFYKNLRK